MNATTMTLEHDAAGFATRRGRTAPGTRTPRTVATWLLFCCAFLGMLVVVGGVTRLTHSGLSIVEWQPLIGTLPPLNDAQWAETFAKYQLTPEYQKVNKGMSLEAFKGIFWWEYVHRLLARALGAVFLVPLLWFALRRRIDAPLARRLGAIFLLGGAQGAMGWYMVQSGLVDNPRVSHLRLTAHLGLAIVIFAAMFWLALDQLALSRARAEGWVARARARASARRALARSPARRASVGLAWLAGASAVAVVLQVLSGGMVAGIRAGFAYNTFPLMAGEIFPPGILMIEPWYMNLVYNVATIQFVHRMLAWIVLAMVAAVAWKARGESLDRSARIAVIALVAAVCVQFALGVATLVLVVPIPLAAAHQGGAVVLLAAALAAAHALCRAAPGPGETTASGASPGASRGEPVA